MCVNAVRGWTTGSNSDFEYLEVNLKYFCREIGRSWKLCPAKNTCLFLALNASIPSIGSSPVWISNVINCWESLNWMERTPKRCWFYSNDRPSIVRRLIAVKLWHSVTKKRWQTLERNPVQFPKPLLLSDIKNWKTTVPLRDRLYFVNEQWSPLPNSLYLSLALPLFSVRSWLLAVVSASCALSVPASVRMEQWTEPKTQALLPKLNRNHSARCLLPSFEIRRGKNTNNSATSNQQQRIKKRKKKVKVKKHNTINKI